MNARVLALVFGLLFTIGAAYAALNPDCTNALEEQCKDDTYYPRVWGKTCVEYLCEGPYENCVAYNEKNGWDSRICTSKDILLYEW